MATITLHTRIVDEVGQQIATGRIAPGSVLTVEELGERFGASRSVVREAFRSLESLGMVVARPQVGTRVQPSALWDAFNPRVISWIGAGAANLDQLRELLVVRMGLEPVAAQLALAAGDTSLADRLQVAVDQMAAAFETEDERAYITADADFHIVLLTASGNRFLARFALILADVLVTRGGSQLRALNENTANSIREHRTIVAAIRAADPKQAREAIRAVIRSTLDEVDQID